MAEEAQQGSLKRATLQTGEFPPGYETVMIVARGLASRCGSIAAVSRIGPSKLVVMTASASASSQVFRSSGRMMPAL